MPPTPSAPPLTAVPLEGLEPTLEAIALAAGSASRQALLSEADALRGGDGAARRRALACYRSFRASLDPARPADAARILWALENDARRDGAVGALAAAAAGSPDAGLRDTASLVLGQAAAEEGRTAEAEEHLRTLFERHRGSGRRLERLACLSLARAYAGSRRGFEALATARLAAGLARKAGDAGDLCAARARICMALEVIGDGERLAAAVEELERGLDEIPPEKARAFRSAVLGFRAEAALAAGDLEGARRAVEGLHALGEGSPGNARLPVYLEAELEYRSGRPGSAAALVRRAREIPERVPASDLPLDMLEARCLLEGGDREGARGILRRILDLLDEEPDPDPLGAGRRIRWSLEAGRILQDRCADPELARRAFDIAAGRVLRRISEVDRSVARLPELAGVASEDLQALSAHRDRFVRDQGEILDRVAALFGEEAPPPGLVHGEEGGEEGYFRACAWCRRVRNGAGRWLPVGEFLPEGRRLRISHGICTDCHRRMAEGRGR